MLFPNRFLKGFLCGWQFLVRGKTGDRWNTERVRDSLTITDIALGVEITVIIILLTPTTILPEPAHRGAVAAANYTKSFWQFIRFRGIVLNTGNRRFHQVSNTISVIVREKKRLLPYRKHSK